MMRLPRMSCRQKVPTSGRRSINPSACLSDYDSGTFDVADKQEDYCSAQWRKWGGGSTKSCSALRERDRSTSMQSVRVHHCGGGAKPESNQADESAMRAPLRPMLLVHAA